MSKCSRNRTIAKLLGQKKIEETTQVTLNIANDIDACAKIVTSRYLELVGTAGAFRPTSVPQDLINTCDSVGCKNSGTLYVTSNDTVEETEQVHTSGAKFQSVSDSTEYFGGMMYYYLNLPKGGEYEVTTTISDLEDTNQTNADKYVQTITSANGGFVPVTIDLAVAPTEDVGSGWVATTNGVTVKIEVTLKDTEEGTISIGISSISLFESMEDLEGNISVILGCLTGIEGTDGLSALESACEQAQYDTTSVEVTRSITARQWSPNIHRLNPLTQKGDSVTGGYIVTVEKKIESDEEGAYGSVHLSDLYTQECGYVYASLKDSCNIYDSAFTRLNNPNLLNLNERQFQVIDSNVSPESGIVGAKLYFNKEMIGETVLVTYYREGDCEEYIATVRGLNDKRVKMTYQKEDTDGTMRVFNYRNVLITSFPMSLSNTDTEFTFEISVQRDLEGTYYTQKIFNKAGYTL